MSQHGSFLRHTVRPPLKTRNRKIPISYLRRPMKTTRSRSLHRRMGRCPKCRRPKRKTGSPSVVNQPHRDRRNASTRSHRSRSVVATSRYIQNVSVHISCRPDVINEQLQEADDVYIGWHGNRRIVFKKRYRHDRITRAYQGPDSNVIARMAVIACLDLHLSRIRRSSRNEQRVLRGNAGGRALTCRVDKALQTLLCGAVWTPRIRELVPSRTSSGHTTLAKIKRNSIATPGTLLEICSASRTSRCRGTGTVLMVVRH